MDLWVAFTLGLFGSLHCAGMCGPLALALPRGNDGTRRLMLGRIAYNAGRTLTYAAIGALFGLAGQTLILAGVQRWLSIALGVLLLAGWFVFKKGRLSGMIARVTNRLAAPMKSLLRRPSPSSLLLLGLMNGLLPCGLVYVAAAGAAATGSAAEGAAYMGVFGAGTVPMLLAISLSGSLVPMGLRLKLLKAVPFTVMALAALLILRGMSLGIPYISPDLSGQGSCCHSDAP
jgi:sulfite exporter TauE/SafE